MCQPGAGLAVAQPEALRQHVTVWLAVWQQRRCSVLRCRLTVVSFHTAVTWHGHTALACPARQPMTLCAFGSVPALLNHVRKQVPGNLLGTGSPYTTFSCGCYRPAGTAHDIGSIIAATAYAACRCCLRGALVIMSTAGPRRSCVTAGGAPSVAAAAIQWQQVVAVPCWELPAVLFSKASWLHCLWLLAGWQEHSCLRMCSCTIIQCSNIVDGRRWQQAGHWGAVDGAVRSRSCCAKGDLECCMASRRHIHGCQLAFCCLVPPRQQQVTCLGCYLFRSCPRMFAVCLKACLT